MTDLPPPPPPNMAPPPGYVAYGGPGAAPLPQVQQIGGLSKALFVLMCIVVPLQVVGVLNTINVVSKARKAVQGTITYDEFDKAMSGGLAGVSGIAGFLVLPVAVITMLWMYRMATNLRLLGRTGATWAPGWAVGGWFVPPAAIYVVPWLMFRELWKGSDPDVAPHDPSWKQGKVTPLIDAWWVLYGLAPLVSIVTTVSMVVDVMDTDSEELAKSYDDFASISIAMSVVGVITGVVYLLMVRQLSDRHMRATHERA